MILLITHRTPHKANGNGDPELSVASGLNFCTTEIASQE